MTRLTKKMVLEQLCTPPDFEARWDDGQGRDTVDLEKVRGWLFWQYHALHWQLISLEQFNLVRRIAGAACSALWRYRWTYKGGDAPLFSLHDLIHIVGASLGFPLGSGGFNRAPEVQLTVLGRVNASGAEVLERRSRSMTVLNLCDIEAPLTASGALHFNCRDCRRCCCGCGQNIVPIARGV